MKNNGKALERQVRTLLDAMHVGFFRVDQARCFKCGQVMNASTRGWPDFLAFKNGRMFALECKSGKAVLTPDQKHWKGILELCGVVYSTIHDPQEVVDLLTR